MDDTVNCNEPYALTHSVYSRSILPLRTSLFVTVQPLPSRKLLYSSAVHSWAKRIPARLRIRYQRFFFPPARKMKFGAIRMPSSFRTRSISESAFCGSGIMCSAFEMMTMSKLLSP